MNGKQTELLVKSQTVVIILMSLFGHTPYGMERKIAKLHSENLGSREAQTELDLIFYADDSVA